MAILVAYTFPERQYKEIMGILQPKLGDLEIEAPPWPHISVALVKNELSQKERKEIIEQGKNKPTFQIKGLKILQGGFSPRAYLVLELDVPKGFVDFHDWIAERNEVHRYAELKPHCSITSVPKAQSEQLESRIPELQRAAQKSLYPFKPGFVSIWDDFQVSQISEDGTPSWLGYFHDLIESA